MELSLEEFAKPPTPTGCHRHVFRRLVSQVPCGNDVAASTVALTVDDESQSHTLLTLAPAARSNPF